MNRLLASILAAAAAALAGCSGTSVSTRSSERLANLRATGYRVAVVPFVNEAPDESFLTSALSPVGDALSLDGRDLASARDAVALRVRADVVAWLRQSPFDVVEPWVADTQIAHLGWTPAQVADPSRAERLAQALQVDGLVYGAVTRWNRSYYVVQSEAEVGLRLQLLDRDGSELFATERTESIGSGLSGGPTGYGSAISAPVEGLGGGKLLDLVRMVARHAATDLGGLMPGEEPSPLLPRLSIVSLASRADGPFRAGDRIDVVAVGTPDCEVTFDLGRLRTRVPMRQVAVVDDPRGARATYEGHYVVQRDEPAATLPLFAAIEQKGRRGTRSRYRWEGEVRLEGRAD